MSIRCTGRILALLCLLLSTLHVSQAQYDFTARVVDPRVDSTTLSFAIELSARDTVPVLLGNAQFILSFDTAGFHAPTVSLVSGSTQLLSSSGGNASAFYATNIFSDIADNLARISINQPVFSSQSQFRTRIARIDSGRGRHRIGRFRLTGIVDTSRWLDLQWRLGSNPYCKLFSLDSVSPWYGSEKTGLYLLPPAVQLPVTLLSFDAQRSEAGVRLSWRTVDEHNNAGFEIHRRSGMTATGYGADGWSLITHIAPSQGPGVHSYAYLDPHVDPGRHEYALLQRDADGSVRRLAVASVLLSPPAASTLSAYPNPATAMCIVQPPAHARRVQVCRIDGRIMISREHDGASALPCVLDVTTLAPGSYMIVSEGDGGMSATPLHIVR